MAYNLRRSTQAKGGSSHPPPPLPQLQQPQPLLGPCGEAATTDSAAIEVFRLLGFVLDMWSRHRESLRAMACGGDLREEDKEVVERLGKELRELLEEEEIREEDEGGSSSLSDKEEVEAEVGQGQHVSLSSSVAWPRGKQDQATRSMRKKRKRSSRRKRSRQSIGAEAESEVNGTNIQVNMPLPPPSSAIECLPHVVLMRVVDMLGTPPRADHPEKGSHRLTRVSFLSDLTRMAQVCHRWKKVRSSGVWKAVCEWRWPWLTSEGGGELVALPKDRRHGAIMEEIGGGDGLLSSPWLDVCVRVGRCMGEGSWARESILQWTQDYTMVVEICEISFLNRLLSESGSFSYEWDGDDGLVDDLGAIWTVRCGANLRRRSWPLRLALGLHPDDDILQALCSTLLAVDVMVMDKRTGKMARLYTNSGLSFHPVPGPESTAHDRVERKLVLLNKDQCFRFISQIHLIEQEEEGVGQGMAVSLGFSLKMRTPAVTSHADIHSLIKSLEWF